MLTFSAEGIYQNHKIEVSILLNQTKMNIPIPIIADSLLKKKVYKIVFSMDMYKKYCDQLSSEGKLNSSLVFQDFGIPPIMYVIDFRSLDEVTKLVKQLDPSGRVNESFVDFDENDNLNIDLEHEKLIFFSNYKKNKAYQPAGRLNTSGNYLHRYRYVPNYGIVSHGPNNRPYYRTYMRETTFETENEPPTQNSEDPIHSNDMFYVD